MKNWYRIEFFNDDYRVFMCECKYTSINRIGCDFECRYDFT